MSGKVVVLGAAGFIGRHVCRALAHRGKTVFGMGHGHWGGGDWSVWGLSRWLEADITVETLAHFIGDDSPQALVHCAGSGAVAYAYAAPFDDYQRTVLSAAAVLEFARTRLQAGCRVVLTSSAAVYGDQGDVDLTETSTRSPISPYGFNKVAAESVCDSYSRFFGIQTSIVRLFSVYGEGLKKQLLWDAMSKYSRGESRFFGTGNELRDWLHVGDAADLLCLAALTPQSSFEIYNGGHEKATTRAVLSSLVAHSSLDSVPTFSGETHAGNPRRLTANSLHAQRQLGWTPQVSLVDGLARYAHWFAEMAHQ
jgi:UDP-glucose 4-epimerase